VPVAAREIGHASKGWFKRQLFGTGDHSPLDPDRHGLMEPGIAPGVTFFNVREKDILKGRKVQ